MQYFNPDGTEYNPEEERLKTIELRVAAIEVTIDGIAAASTIILKEDKQDNAKLVNIIVNSLIIFGMVVVFLMLTSGCAKKEFITYTTLPSPSPNYEDRIALLEARIDLNDATPCSFVVSYSNGQVLIDGQLVN